MCAAILVATAIVAAGLFRDRSADATILQTIADATTVFGLAAFGVTGALIVSRQPRNLVGWLLLLEGSLAFLWPLDLYFMALAQPPAQPSSWFMAGLWLRGWMWLWYIFPILFIPLFFPSGKLLSRRWRWLVVLGLGLCAFFLLFSTLITDWVDQDGRWSVPNPLGIGFLPVESFPMAPWAILLLSFAFLSVASLFVRYHRAQTVERRQIKWLLYAAGLFFVVYVSAFVFSDMEAGPGSAFVSFILLLGVLAFPIAIASAILRYRLYDIDIIIRKTLQYTVITALLSIIYFGSVFFLQRLFSNFTGQQSPLILVVSTLLIAALFAPLRRRIQDGIDRRFRSFTSFRTRSTMPGRWWRNSPARPATRPT